MTQKTNYIALAFLLSFFLNISPLLAQKGYSPGHVILNSGDTLQGMLQDRTEDKIFTKIKFRGESSGKAKYSPHDITGYKIGGTEYESMWWQEHSEFFMFDYYNLEDEGEKIFLKVLARGPVTCYYLEYIDPDSGYPDGFALFKREEDYYFQRASQGIFGLKKKKLAEYFRECPDLVEKIESGSIKSPVEVVDYYNMHCTKTQ